MPRNIKSTHFNTLAQKIAKNTSNNLPTDVTVNKDNPYIILKTNNKLPQTREETISALSQNLPNFDNTTYYLTFTNIDKTNLGYEYTIRIKEMTNSPF